MALRYNEPLLLTLLPCHPFWVIEGTCCEQSRLPGKASLHCDPLPHIWNVGPIFHLAGRELWQELCWLLTHWQQACQANDVVGAFARLSFAFPFVFCEYTKTQRIRNDLSYPLWFLIGPYTCGSLFRIALVVACGAGGVMGIHTLCTVLIARSSNEAKHKWAKWEREEGIKFIIRTFK